MDETYFLVSYKFCDGSNLTVKVHKLNWTIEIELLLWQLGFRMCHFLYVFQKKSDRPSSVTIITDYLIEAL